MDTKGKKTKQVKLQTKYWELVYGQEIVPELKLSAIWLAELGFRPRDSKIISERGIFFNKSFKLFIKLGYSFNAIAHSKNLQHCGLSFYRS